MTVESHAIKQWPGGVKTPRARHQEVSPNAFATLQNLSLLEWALLMRDNAYQQTALGPMVVEFLAYMKIGGAKPSGRSSSTSTTWPAAACSTRRSSLKAWGDTEMLHVAASFKDKERRVRVAAWRSFFKWALKQGLVDRNPCDRLPEMKAEPQRFIDTFSDAEIDVLTALPPGTAA